VGKIIRKVFITRQRKKHVKLENNLMCLKQQGLGIILHREPKE
jgi:hypothetical protein